MSDFLTNLAGKCTAEKSPVMPRLQSRFESQHSTPGQTGFHSAHDQEQAVSIPAETPAVNPPVASHGQQPPDHVNPPQPRQWPEAPLLEQPTRGNGPVQPPQGQDHAPLFQSSVFPVSGVNQQDQHAPQNGDNLPPEPQEAKGLENNKPTIPALGMLLSNEIAPLPVLGNQVVPEKAKHLELNSPLPAAAPGLGAREIGRMIAETLASNSNRGQPVDAFKVKNSMPDSENGLEPPKLNQRAPVTGQFAEGLDLNPAVPVIAAPAPVNGNSPNASQTPDLQPQVHIHIGRVEIKASHPAPKAAPAPKQKAQIMSLEQYLAGQPASGGSP